MRAFGLIGKPLTHSFSKSFFTEKFVREGLSNCSYQNFELPSIEALPQLLQTHPSLEGFNITIPYKEKILPYLDDQNDMVQQVGACNCVKIERGKLLGYNTDVVGFKQSIEKSLKPHHKKGLILGTGGAAKAVAYAFHLLQIESKYVSRSAEHGFTYDALDQAAMNEHTVIVNTTPLGMYPQTDAAPHIPYQYLTSQHLLFDLTYNPTKTLFLKKGEDQGAAIANGFEMLVLQAEESWKIWNS